MKIAVVGTGYVGLVSGVGFAEKGNDVTCVDINEAKVKQLQDGQIPIYEPGLEPLFEQNKDEGRLTFTSSLAEGVEDAAAIFLALPTPEAQDGSADLSYVLNVARQLGPLLTMYTVIVDKSTVPVGTTKLVGAAIAEGVDGVEYDVVSNPEFLREGRAVSDFMVPKQIVVGADSERAARLMQKIYRSFVKRDPESLVITSPATAELAKYAINAFLATKISFVNSLTPVCEESGANISELTHIMGRDPRIGSEFLHASLGWGGSCFPKDTMALIHYAESIGLPLDIVQAAYAANERQKQVIPKRVLNFFNGNVEGKTIALWGLAFKDDTDDVRMSAAIDVISTLTAAGANVVAFDPHAIQNMSREFPDNHRLSFAEGEYEALEGADALVIATNWDKFDSPNTYKMRRLMREPVIFDGRNLYNPQDMEEDGFYYTSIGRETVDGREAA